MSFTTSTLSRPPWKYKHNLFTRLTSDLKQTTVCTIIKFQIYFGIFTPYPWSTTLSLLHSMVNRLNWNKRIQAHYYTTIIPTIIPTTYQVTSSYVHRLILPTMQLGWFFSFAVSHVPTHSHVIMHQQCSRCSSAFERTNEQVSRVDAECVHLHDVWQTSTRIARWSR